MARLVKEVNSKRKEERRILVKRFSQTRKAARLEDKKGKATMVEVAASVGLHCSPFPHTHTHSHERLTA